MWHIMNRKNGKIQDFRRNLHFLTNKKWHFGGKILWSISMINPQKFQSFINPAEMLLLAQHTTCYLLTNVVISQNSRKQKKLALQSKYVKHDRLDLGVTSDNSLWPRSLYRRGSVDADACTTYTVSRCFSSLRRLRSIRGRVLYSSRWLLHLSSADWTIL